MSHAYQQHYICEPVYNMGGHLVALEVLTRFFTAQGRAVAYGEMSDILTPEYKWLNFVRQVHGVRLWQAWLQRHQVCVSLNLDGETAVWLLRDRHIQALLATMPFLRLEVHEHFPVSGKESHALLNPLRACAGLWLDDVGSGSCNNFGWLVKKHFSGAKIDKRFFWHNHDTNRVLLGKVIRDLTRYAGHVIVEGIEHEGHLRALDGHPHCWLQGHLFQHTDIEHMAGIPLRITCVA